MHMNLVSLNLFCVHMNLVSLNLFCMHMNLVSLNLFCVHMNDRLFARTDVWIWMNEKVHVQVWIFFPDHC